MNFSHQNGNSGIFVVLEGTDGSGKSTQIRKLRSYLIECGIHVKLVREPGSTDIGEAIRKILLDPQFKEMDKRTEAYLYAASRAQLVSRVIRPAINRGSYVICDRFLYSSLVYQGVARGLGVDRVFKLNKMALCGIKPDVAIFLDLPVEKAIKRFKNGTEDRIEKESIEFHKKVYNAYIELCNDPRFNLHRIDADRDIDEVFEDIKAVVDREIEKVKQCSKLIKPQEFKQQ